MKIHDINHPASSGYPHDEETLDASAGRCEVQKSRRRLTVGSMEGEREPSMVARPSGLLGRRGRCGRRCDWGGQS